MDYRSEAANFRQQLFGQLRIGIVPFNQFKSYADVAENIGTIP